MVRSFSQTYPNEKKEMRIKFKLSNCMVFMLQRGIDFMQVIFLIGIIPGSSKHIEQNECAYIIIDPFLIYIRHNKCHI